MKRGRLVISLIKATVGVFAILASVGPAFAHSQLLASTPASGSVVTAPTELVLSFSEAIEPTLSKAELQCAGGKISGLGQSRVDANGKTLRITLPPLPQGKCEVSWIAVSVDGHRTHGEFTFTDR